MFFIDAIPGDVLLGPKLAAFSSSNGYPIEWKLAFNSGMNGSLVSFSWYALRSDVIMGHQICIVLKQRLLFYADVSQVLPFTLRTEYSF